MTIGSAGAERIVSDEAAAYFMTNYARLSFTRGLALECYERRIRVNALRLGAVDTEMLWNNPQVKSGEEAIDKREVGTPAEVAEIALFLASNKSSFISGSVLTADGGRLPILGSHSQR